MNTQQKEFANKRHHFSGRKILSERNQYRSFYGIFWPFIFTKDLFRITKKILVKKCKPFYKTQQVSIRRYAEWIDTLKTDHSHFVQYDNNSFSREPNDVKIYAFYLPQFYAIPENDNAYGKGFTEWTNVTQITPQFIGHEQPKIPYDLGFYNLKMPGIIERQVELAKNYGIYGFCFYYYWFSGHKLLKDPLDYFLHSDIDFHFHLCWATGNWSKRWDGGENELILKQTLSVNDAVPFFEDILPFIKDSRYEKINGKPLLIIYSPGIFDKETFVLFTERLNNLAFAAGFNGFHILSTNAYGFDLPLEYGCDGLVEFPPHDLDIDNYYIRKPILNKRSDFSIVDMTSFISDAKYAKENKYITYRTCFPSWDNTPRKLYTGGFCFLMNEDDFYKWLFYNIQYTKTNLPTDRQITYINAWNEWAEGAILEPTVHDGYKNLSIVKKVLQEAR